MKKQCTGCVVSAGTHKPAEALHQQIAEPQECCRSHPHEKMTPMCELRTEIARLTNALARAEAAAPQAVQAAVPTIAELESSAELGALRDVYEMARGVLRFDGIDMERAIKYKDGLIEAIETVKTIDGGTWEPEHPAEGVPAQPLQNFESPRAKILMQAWQEGFAACRDAEYVGEEAENDAFNQSMTLNHCIAEDELHATQPAAQGMEAIRALIAQHGKELEHNAYAYFELAYTRQTGWMAWITDHPRSMPPTEVVNPDRKVLASGQGDTPEAACAAALAAQAKQGGAHAT